jgi:hypothetical protein
MSRKFIKKKTGLYFLSDEQITDQSGKFYQHCQSTDDGVNKSFCSKTQEIFYFPFLIWSKI